MSETGENLEPRKGPGRPKGKLGKRSKLTPELSKKFCEYVELGYPFVTAAGLCGIDEGTIQDWIRRGRGTHKDRACFPEHVQFVADVTRALAASESQLIEKVKAGAEQDWRAASWVLSRRFRERWSESFNAAIAIEKAEDRQAKVIMEVLQNFLSPEKMQELREYMADVNNWPTTLELPE